MDATGKQKQVFIEIEILDKIKEIAKKENRYMRGQIVYILKEYIKNYENKKEED